MKTMITFAKKVRNRVIVLSRIFFFLFGIFATMVGVLGVLFQSEIDVSWWKIILYQVVGFAISCETLYDLTVEKVSLELTHVSMSKEQYNKAMMEEKVELYKGT